jgi:hypothetical protein
MVLAWNRVYSGKMKVKHITFMPGSTSVRMVARLTTALITCSALGLLAGCATQPESHVVTAPPPPAPVRSLPITTTITSSDPMPLMFFSNATNVLVSTATPAVGTTVVTATAPATQTKVVLAQPSPKYVWLAGYWSWRNDRYEWMAGHWQLPPNSNAVWVTPRWEQQGNAYKFTEGYWN